jgi:hypothetical protein
MVQKKGIPNVVYIYSKVVYKLPSEGYPNPNSKEEVRRVDVWIHRKEYGVVMAKLEDTNMEWQPSFDGAVLWHDDREFIVRYQSTYDPYIASIHERS